MTNQEIFDKWLNHCNPTTFSMDEYYTTLFCDSDGSVEYIFDILQIKQSDVIKSKDPIINECLVEIDNLTFQSMKEVERFIKNCLLGEMDVDDVIDEVRYLKDDIRDYYNEKLINFNQISHILGGREVDIQHN